MFPCLFQFLWSLILLGSGWLPPSSEHITADPASIVMSSLLLILTLPASFLQGPLGLHWAHPDNPGHASHLSNLLSSAVPFAIEGNIHRFWGVGHGHILGGIILPITPFCLHTFPGTDLLWSPSPFAVFCRLIITTLSLSFLNIQISCHFVQEAFLHFSNPP